MLDTRDAASRARSPARMARCSNELASWPRATRADAELAARIRDKFAIKNTTGYSLNALVDFTDPFDILAAPDDRLGGDARLHLRDHLPHRAGVRRQGERADAVPRRRRRVRRDGRLKRAPVAAAELMDRATPAIGRGQAGHAGIHPRPGRTALRRCWSRRARRAATALAANIDEITRELADLPTLLPAAFTDRSRPSTSGCGTSARACSRRSARMRETGTTVIIEDVAFPIESLAAPPLDLQELLDEHGYHEAIIFGHALEGNLHFVFTQDFGNASEVDRYRRFMDAVCEMVVEKYDGSLKAEHGTGRNMAPFVELEWGAQAYALMREIKRCFDPTGLLNPGVILNDDPQAHLKNLKPLPAADPLVDKCIECGFCERMCPSQG